MSSSRWHRWPSSWRCRASSSALCGRLANDLSRNGRLLTACLGAGADGRGGEAVLRRLLRGAVVGGDPPRLHPLGHRPRAPPGHLLATFLAGLRRSHRMPPAAACAGCGGGGAGHARRPLPPAAHDRGRGELASRPLQTLARETPQETLSRKVVWKRPDANRPLGRAQSLPNEGSAVGIFLIANQGSPTAC